MPCGLNHYFIMEFWHRLWMDTFIEFIKRKGLFIETGYGSHGGIDICHVA